MTSLKTGLSSITLLTAVLLMLNGCNSGSSPSGSAESSEPEEQLFSVGDLAGSHILVSYAGANRADESVTRSKEEAMEKAKELSAKLQVSPSMFEEFAMQESDGPSGPSGGDLGTWAKGQMVPEFDTAIELLDVGAITSDPVETAFGYHIIRRNELEKVPHYSSDAFIIAYKSPQTPPNLSDVSRTQDEALALADSIKETLNKGNFDDLAMKYNDLSEGAIPLPTFHVGGREAIPGLADTLKTMAFGDVDGPLSIPIGYAFVRRLKVDKRAGAHILISYQGAQSAGPDITISKEEALGEAKRIIELAKENPDQFGELATEHSDGPSGPSGGDLGTWFKGSMVPEFDEAIDDLEVGEISDEPVETPYGFHVIMRNPL